jgi:hypothetical protein
VLRSLRARATYANLVSTICLFVLLGGGAYAASQLAKNSVGARQIKTNGVRTAEVKDGSLLAADFKLGQLPEGPRGPSGADGTARAFGVISDTGVVDSARSKGITVTKITGQAGAYCVRPDASTGIDPSKVRPIATADLATGAGSTHLAQISTSNYYPAQCPPADGWEVYTQTQTGGGAFATADAGFSILIP